MCGNAKCEKRNEKDSKKCSVWVGDARCEVLGYEEGRDGGMDLAGEFSLLGERERETVLMMCFVIKGRYAEEDGGWEESCCWEGEADGGEGAGKGNVAAEEGGEAL